MQSRRHRLMGSTILVGAFAAGMAGAATAQVTPTEQSAGVSPTTANATPATEEVVVTGSRIRSPNLTSVSPMAVVTDQEVKLEGATNIENLLNSLPQVVAGQQSNVSNGASGTATVDLRGLGPSRTLVLVDGKRLMPGDPSLPYADLNNIPSAMVDRVEVVTGGASAVYGADAVAGVVNFILKKDFQGVQIDAQYGFAQHDNDNTEFRSLQGTQGISNFPQAPGDYTASLSKEVSAIIGANAPDGKGNITAYATWRELEPITQNNYDVSACSLALKNNGKGSSYNYNTHFCSGSSNSQYGRFNVVTANGTGGTLHDNPNGTQTLVSTSVPAYNYAPQNYFQRPEDRYTAGFNANYEVNKMLDIYSSLMFADDHTVAQIAPSGLFAGTGPNGGSTYQINCNNPLLSASEATQLCGAAAGTPAVANALIGYRFAGYNRQDDLRHTNYKIDIGARGELAPGWNYDAYLQYGTTIYSEEYVNDASTTKIQNALLVDPTTGKCENDASTCVPLNIFQYGGLTKAAVQYALTPGFKNGQTVEQIADISVTGDLGQYGMKSPWATDGIGVAFGTEYRRESLDLNVDQEFSSGDLSGQGGPTKGVSGSFDVYELFGEMRVPIVQDMPFVKSLTTDIGYRFSDYSSTGTTNTYKIDLDWAIDSNFRLRSGYNRAVRAPNIDELYAPSSVGDTSASDPCAGLTTYTQACLNTFSTLAAKEGKTEAQVAAGLTNIAQCPAAQCSGLFGGNANLTPETADTYTAGIVFTPTWSWSRGFSASIDYYNIQVYNAITSIATQNIINQCEAGVASFCNLINRDPSSGILFGQTGYVTDTDINSGYNKTQGVDVAATYTFRPTQWGLPNWGSLNVNLIATEVFKFQIQPVAQGGSYDCTGLYGPTCGTPLPRLRTKVRFTYTPPSFPAEFSLDWRHLSGVKLDANEGNPLLHNLISGVITDSADEQIDAYDYFDFSVLWHVRDNLSARAGVSNLFDKDPPGLDSNYLPASGPPEGNGNTYPGVYDSLGRTFFVGLTADF